MNLSPNQPADLLAKTSEDKLDETKASNIKLALRKEPEVLKLAQSIDERDQLKILEFGKEPAVQISRFSDQILANMRTTNVEDSGELLKQLGRIMDKFDAKDFKKADSGFLLSSLKRAKKWWKNYLANTRQWALKLIKYM